MVTLSITQVRFVLKRIGRSQGPQLTHEDAVHVARCAGLAINETRTTGASWDGRDIQRWYPARTVLAPFLRGERSRLELSRFTEGAGVTFNPFIRAPAMKSIPRVSRSPDILIHDIAHYLVCPPHRRRVPDFGLGPDPDRGGEPGYCAPQLAIGHAEEERASLLGILFEVALGGEGARRFCEHAWDFDDEDGIDLAFTRTLCALHHAGLVSQRGTPTCLRRRVRSSS